jgi:murein tripeptide amidase MpaA
LATDPKYERLRSLYTFTVIPVVNIDGYAVTRDYTNGDRFWRKNLQPNSNQTDPYCQGTDPNRNFGFEWGSQNDGASPDPCDDAYHGPEAFSSEEAKAVADYILKEGNVVSYIDFHSYSRLWMFP